MMYRCRQCSYVAKGPGNCPTCNIPMEILQQTEAENQTEETPEVQVESTPEVAPESTDTETAPVTPAAPAEGDADAPKKEGGEA